MAYSPPREEQEGCFLDDMSFTSEEETLLELFVTWHFTNAMVVAGLAGDCIFSFEE